MNEFDLIRRLAAASRPGGSEITGSGPGVGMAARVAIGIGDDAAVLDVDGSSQWVVTTDTLVSGLHFEPDVSPGDLGYKALAVNLSDLAAMGADPAWHLLSLTGPEPGGDWVERFAGGMAELATAAGSTLVGGDTTGGPLTVTVTAIGVVPRGQALLRRGARAGDLVVVSGVPGLAARALAASPGDDVPSPAREHLLRPQPRLALGRALRGRVSACIDVSDGLAADLGHILEASGVGAELWLDRLPRPEVFDGLDDEARWNLQLGGGDDYELCFALPAARANDVAELATRGGIGLTPVGRIVEGSSLACLRADGTEFVPEASGWDHFRDD